jgi:hypothetical protein
MWRKERRGAMAGKRTGLSMSPHGHRRWKVYSEAAAALMSFAVSARPATVTDQPRVMLVIPPSITISCPARNPDPSLARKTAAWAMSSESPARGIGWIVAKRSLSRLSPDLPWSPQGLRSSQRFRSRSRRVRCSSREWPSRPIRPRSSASAPARHPSKRCKYGLKSHLEDQPRCRY